jgi:hypothetical protein
MSQDFELAIGQHNFLLATPRLQPLEVDDGVAEI